jgi:hypothetical protein
MFRLLFGMCCSHHAIETRLHEEKKAQKKLQKDMKEVKKTLYLNKTPSPSSKEREGNPALHLRKDMRAMKTLIHLTHLLPMQVSLKWGLTPSLVETLDSKVTPLMHVLHLLQSS